MPLRITSKEKQSKTVTGYFLYAAHIFVGNRFDKKLSKCY